MLVVVVVWVAAAAAVPGGRFLRAVAAVVLVVVVAVLVLVLVWPTVVPMAVLAPAVQMEIPAAVGAVAQAWAGQFSLVIAQF